MRLGERVGLRAARPPLPGSRRRWTPAVLSHRRTTSASINSSTELRQVNGRSAARFFSDETCRWDACSVVGEEASVGRRSGSVRAVSYSWIMASGHHAKRPGGRTAAVSMAIRNAVEELVAEVGSERVTIPMVAERAGVKHATVYRRWPDAATRPLPDTGDLRADIITWAAEILAHYRKPINAAVLRGGIPIAGDDESDCLDPPGYFTSPACSSQARKTRLPVVGNHAG